ncbi:DUF2785 domain-containing protein [Nocardioides ultimimeridianus]
MVVDWRRVPAADFRVPEGPALADLTAELTGLLGDPDPALRDEVAVPVLTTWIGRGVYDDLMVGLGDGIATGLTATRPADRAALRRTSSAVVLGAVLARDNRRTLVPRQKVLEWGDRIATWLLAERDLGAGAVGAGADALGELVASPHCGRGELRAVLDVLGERVVVEAAEPWRGTEADRLALAAVRLLRRNLLLLDEVEGWAARIGARALRDRPAPAGLNADAFLRSLYLVLALGQEPPPIRADLVLTLVDFLRELHPDLLG